MANTPRYTFTQPPIFGAAIQGGMTAMSGIAQEKAASDKNRQLLNSFADTLQEEGLLADANVYRNYAAAEQPNFMRAAATGQAEKRDLTMPFEHALAAIKAKQQRETQLDVAGIRSTGRGNSMSRAEYSARNDIDSDEISSLQKEVSDLRDDNSRLDRDIILYSTGPYANAERVTAARHQLAINQSRINGLESKVRNLRNSRRSRVDEYYGPGAGTSVVPVPSGGIGGDSLGQGVAFNATGPTEGVPGGEMTSKTPTTGANPLLPQTEGAPYSDSQGNDTSENIPEGKAVAKEAPEATAVASLKSAQDDMARQYPEKAKEIYATTNIPNLDRVVSVFKSQGRTATSKVVYPDAIAANAAGEKLKSVMSSGANYDVVLQPANGGTTFSLRQKGQGSSIWSGNVVAKPEGMYNIEEGGVLKPIHGKDGKIISEAQYASDMRELRKYGIETPEVMNPNQKQVTNNVPSNFQAVDSSTNPNDPGFVGPPAPPGRNALNNFYNSRR